MYKLSTNGLNLIKSFENLELETYRCSAGVLTIGYGHTGKDVKVGMRITEKQALSLLAKDTDFASRYVNSLQIAKTQNQFDALTSFVFNVGCGNKSTPMLLSKQKRKAFRNQHSLKKSLLNTEIKIASFSRHQENDI